MTHPHVNLIDVTLSETDLKILLATFENQTGSKQARLFDKFTKAYNELKEQNAIEREYLKLKFEELENQLKGYNGILSKND